MKPKCSICRERINFEQEFIVEGRNGNLLTRTINTFWANEINIIDRFLKTFNGKIYHKKCYIEEVLSK